MSDRIHPAQVAKMTSLSIRKVQEMAAGAQIPGAHKVGSQWFFSRDSVLDWIKDAEHVGEYARELIKTKNLALNIKSMAGELLDKYHIISNSISVHTPESGIYFLIQNEKIVYVGKSTSISSRIAGHKSTKMFDRWFWIPCPSERLDIVERAYINNLLPPLNKDPVTNKMREVGIV